MGCCISKCRPENKPLELLQELNEEGNVIQDKLVISQASPTLLYSSTKISPSPPSPTSSTSSFTLTTSNSTISSSSSSLSTASSIPFTSNSKDRSFSNDFLLSCYKHNPHISRINSLSFTPPHNSLHNTKVNVNPPPSLEKLKHYSSPPQNPATTVGTGSLSLPHKRVRSNSPTNLTRQKSFRRETQRCMQPQGRTLGSPSPSARFNGDKRVHSHSVRKESVKVASPNSSSLRRFHSGLRQRENSFRVGSTKSDDHETVVKVKDHVVSEHDDDMDVTLFEDIHNPLISLDCFIFL